MFPNLQWLKSDDVKRYIRAIYNGEVHRLLIMCIVYIIKMPITGPY